MANLDSRFICTSDVDSYFVDNATGLPMSGGIVTFYSDVNRTVLKPVYQLTGTPGNYSYSPLPNPITLSSSGTYQDGVGNNIVPYYYPFTDIPENDTGVQELYYIVCVNSGFVPQFVRQGWPQAAGSGGNIVTGAELINFIPNGQFLANNNAIAMLAPNVEPYVQYNLGGSTVDAQPIAQGGWNFVYDNGTTATFKNFFVQIPNSGGYPGIQSYPRYAFNFQCTSIGNTPVYRDLQISWPDVYKFSAGVQTGSIYPTYNLFFNAKSNDSNTYEFMINLIFYLGGGAAPVIIPVATISIGSTSYANYNFPLMFPTPSGSLSGNNDDYVAISIKGPSSGWNVSLTDFVLYEGDTALSYFPTDPNATMLSQGVAGWMTQPKQDGSDLYLPLTLTPQGMQFDNSEIGDIVAKTTLVDFNGTSISTVSNELLCDGSAYPVAGYSPLGIPYRRLFNKLYSGLTAICPWGNGTTFVNAITYTVIAGEIVLCTNQADSQTAPANGSTSPGFSYAKSAGTGGNTAGATTRGFKAWANFQGSIWGQCTTIGSTSGIDVSNATGITGGAITDSTADKFQFLISVPVSATLSNGSGMAGQYILVSNTTTTYAFWFNVAGETVPSPGGSPTLVEVQLDSSMDVGSTAAVIANTINAYQTNIIQCVAATTPITAGSWFTFHANSNLYTVWYSVAGVGTQPTVAGTTLYIPVALAGTENASAVAIATQSAINSQYFATPPYQGLFLRGVDPNKIWDNLNDERVSSVYHLLDTLPGTLEYGYFTSHNHAPLSGSFIVGGGSVSGGSGTSFTSSATTTYTGIYETRPVNAAVAWAIKY